MRTNDRELYSTWTGMKQRCYYPKSKSYTSYGGRGITVCDRWLKYNNYEHDILTVLGHKPSSSHTIERINNDGNYEISNVRWATRLEQTFNRRVFKNNKSGYCGVSWNKAIQKWASQTRINGHKTHLGFFLDKEEAHKAYLEATKYRGLV